MWLWEGEGGCHQPLQGDPAKAGITSVGSKNGHQAVARRGGGGSVYILYLRWTGCSSEPDLCFGSVGSSDFRSTDPGSCAPEVMSPPGRRCQRAPDRTDVSDDVVHGHGRALHHVNDGGRGLTGGCEVTADRRLSTWKCHHPLWTTSVSSDELQGVLEVLGEPVLVPTDTGSRAQSCGMIWHLAAIFNPSSVR